MSTNPYAHSPQSFPVRDGPSPEFRSLLWLAAGATWSIIALKAWSLARRSEARRKSVVISDRLLGEVFPDGIPA